MMDDDVEDLSVTSNLVAQTYCEGLKRIADVSSKRLLTAEIPKEVLIQREKSWNQLFRKYSHKFLDSVELNINTLKPEGKTNDVLLESCLSVPKAKQIQFWINTGKSPYIHVWQGQTDTNFSPQNKKSSILRRNSLTRRGWNDRGDRYSDLNSIARTYCVSAPRTQYCKKKKFNVYKVLTHTANKNYSNFLSASDLHSHEMASKSIKANNDAYFKAHCDETEKMESQDQVHVKISSLEEKNNIKGQPKSIDDNDISTCTSQFLNNAIKHLSINNKSKTQSDNGIIAELPCGNEIITLLGCISNDVPKESHLSMKTAATQYLTVNNNASTKENDDVQSEPLSDDELFPHPSKFESSNVSRKTHCFLDNIAADYLNTNSNKDSETSSEVREVILSDDDIFQFESNRSSGFSKSPHSKKLYTGRESPVDLAKPQSLSSSRTSLGEKSSHPALDPELGSSVCHRRFKRKRKQSSLCVDATSEFYSDDCQLDSTDNSSELRMFDNSDSTKSASTQNQSESPFKFKTPISSVPALLNDEEKLMTTDDSTGSITSESTENQTPGVADEADNLKTSLLPVSKNDEILQLGDINDDPSCTVPGKQIPENDSEPNRLHVVETIKNRTEAERESINTVDTSVSVCRRNAEMSNNSTSKSFLCEVQDIDNDTVDSDQSTIIFCGCKSSTALACNCENLSITDYGPCENYNFLERETPIVAPVAFQAENLSPIVLLKRLDENIFKKTLVVSKDVSSNVNKAPFKDTSTSNSYAHETNSIYKRRKLEPVVVLTKLEHCDGFPVKPNQLPPKRSINKRWLRSDNRNVNKLFVDFSGSTPGKNYDKSDVDRKRNGEPVVVLNPTHVMGNQSSHKRRVRKEQAYVDDKRTTSSPLSSNHSINQDSRTNANLCNQNVTDVDNRVSISPHHSRLRKLRCAGRKLVSLLSPDQQDFKSNRRRTDGRATDSFSKQERKSVPPSYLVKRRSQQRSTTDRSKIAKIKRLRANVRLSIRQREHSNASSSINYPKPSRQRTLLQSVAQHGAWGPPILENRLIRSLCFETDFCTENDLTISTPPSSGRSIASGKRVLRKLKPLLTPRKLNTDSSSNSTTTVSQGSLFRPRRICRSSKGNRRVLDTSDEEELRFGSTVKQRLTRNQAKSFTEKTQLEPFTKQRTWQKRRGTVNNNIQTVSLDNAEKEPHNILPGKSGTLRKNRRSVRESLAKNATNESSRESPTFRKKSYFSKRKSYASFLDDSS